MTAYMGESPRVIASDGKVTSPVMQAAKSPSAFDPARPNLGASASGADAGHYLEWIRACQGGPPARANYGFEGPIVETLLLGCIAVRTHEALTWDAQSFSLTHGSARATALLKPAYRAPYAL